jgi:transcriptional regulator with XRE-family HTH domain
MTLREWMDKKGYKTKEAAKLLGLSKRTLRSYLSGERSPRDEVMGRIIFITGGKVLPSDIYNERQKLRGEKK